MKHLLYIEDDKIDQIAFRRIIDGIEQIRYTITDYVEQAISLEDPDQYDLIITDYQLSDGSAHEVIAHFHSKPVLVITGSLRPDEHALLTAAGAIAYISKPLEKATFIPLLNEILKKMEQSTPKFDLSYLKDLSQGDEEFEKEMLGIFLQEVPEGLHLLEEKLAQAQWIEASKEVHKLKSKIRLLGMESIKVYADEIENNLKKEANLKRTQMLIAKMREGLNQGIEFAHHLIKSSHELSNH